jgi:hypothetical protein
MAVSNHAYLLLKMLGPNGVITIKGNFAHSDACNREFHKISQTFGMCAEFLQIQSMVNHKVSPDIRRAFLDQMFDTDKDTKKIQIHPSEPTKSMSVATSLEAAEKKALVEFLRKHWKVDPLSSTPSMRNSSRNHRWRENKREMEESKEGQRTRSSLCYSPTVDKHT